MPQVRCGQWLLFGPVPAPLPLYHNAKNPKGEKFTLGHLLEFPQVDVSEWWPYAGQVVDWDAGRHLTWRLVQAETSGVALPSAGGVPEVCYLATFIDAVRFTEAKFLIRSPHLFQAMLDGEVLVTQKNSGAKADSSGQAKSIGVETGVHLLLVKALRDPECTAPWRLDATLELPEGWSAAELRLTTAPTQRMSIRHLMDAPRAESIALSPEGELAAVSIRQTRPPGETSEEWIELRRLRDSSLLATYRGGVKLARLAWAPVGRRISYTTSEKELTTLWIVDLDQGSTTPLLRDVQNFSGYTWAPDGTFIIHSVTEKPEPDKSGLKRLQGMPDRWPTWRERSFLYRVSVPQGVRSRVTAGSLTTALNSISPDGRKLLFSRSWEDFSERPYAKTAYYALDLGSMAVDSLWTSGWTSSAQWSPDGQQLLVLGGPSAFQGVGMKVPEGVTPNEYDTQAFLYDLRTGQVDPITKDFDPAINQAVWSHVEPCIYFVATDRAFVHLFRYDLRTRKFDQLDTGAEVIGGLDIALRVPVAAYLGSSACVPPKAFVLDLRKRRARTFVDPAEAAYQHVRFGRCMPWDFVTSQGRRIAGRVYLPPGFDQANKYPCIVYYYGGTSPVTRDFGGRYPKELWAANGYVVYVLEPSGATGFGQAFSALHVNDWGKTVSEEIIEGVKQFLRSHPFVDSTRVGCIGASYGGFMTMLLTTKTDMFAAAVAHAGISSIASYWGEGFWGYLYSSTATANSFPWNRRDIYVDQSPLFMADRVKTPLLLLHGTSDTNVPPGESIQFYTALKLLGRPVELVQVEGQDHTIMEDGKRIRWTKTILAWFDRWLKGQPESWDSLYGEKK
ncbi:MAG: S9 family peptidase [bacterium]|jgi:dipeptidyl aminopeptidase/acylaminoacyl peptidase|nr:S9 family peptidase [candidate division KSB1 bacterium]MDH7560506.1 S9 family peptidase [bacterium]